MRRLYGVQYLRGIAATGVVAYHAADRTRLHFSSGQAGVDIFFVLSGFLMWRITDAQTGVSPFLLDRARRIVPNYWLATSVMMIGAMGGFFPAVRLTLGHVLASYLFAPWVSPSNNHIWPLLVPGWTLNYEMAFYLLFAATLALPRPWQLACLSVVLLLLPSTRLAGTSSSTALRFYTDPHLVEFLAGIWLAVLQIERQGHAAVRALLVIGGAVALSIYGLIHSPKPLPYGPIAFTTVAATLFFERRAHGVPHWIVPRLLGDASYSIYLWHTLAISLSAKVAIALGMPSTAALFLHLVAGIGSGLLAYFVFERPMLTFFRSAASERPRQVYTEPDPQAPA
jgi:exopolysaccharide production protein ExoZ